jgi:hypothetical protein
MYDTKEADDECVKTMMEAARPEPPNSYGEILEKPIDTAEIYQAIRSGGRKKAPESDVLGLEFYSNK